MFIRFKLSTTVPTPVENADVPESNACQPRENLEDIIEAIISLWKENKNGCRANSTRN